MKLRKLITTKPHKYGTRHLTAGEEYEVPPRHAVALVASRKARFADDKPMSRRAAEKSSKTSAEAFIKYMGAKTITGQIGGEPGMVQESDDSIAGPAPTEVQTIDRLRAEAEQIGLIVDGRWGVARLQHEIAQAKR